MTTPNSSFSDIIATSLQGYSKTMADNITNHNALLRQMERKGNITNRTGRTIVQEIEFAENGTVAWFSGSDTISTAQDDTFTAAEYNWKMIAGNAVVTGLEEVQNSGPEAVHNLVKARIRNLDKSMRNTISTALYADGTGSSSKEFGGLRLIVADTNTNEVGGISGNTYSWWRNFVYDFSTLVITASATTIQTAMQTTWLNTIRGMDKPDIIPAGITYYSYYWDSLLANQRFTDDKGAGAGFVNIVYQGNVPVIYDDQCAATRMYFLNTDYLYLAKSPKRWFTPLPDRASINQDAVVMPLVSAGNLTCSNRERQGVICA